MKKISLVAAAVILSGSPLAHARGDYEAGKARSVTCAACHGFDGNSTVPSFPKLAGQHPDYIVHSLKAYKSGKRKNPIMAAQAGPLSEADMANLAAYFSRQTGLTVKY